MTKQEALVHLVSGMLPHEADFSIYDRIDQAEEIYNEIEERCGGGTTQARIDLVFSEAKANNFEVRIEGV